MESEFLEWLRARLQPHPALRLGPGDDAALVRLADSGTSVVTVDLVSDGVDFDLGSTDPRRIGHKALAINLSDLAAMAARPVAAVVALALPRAGALELAQALYEGLLPLAARYQVAVAGGDTNTWDGPLVIAITALGEPTARGVLRRDGARPGDCLLVTGRLGGSRLGKHLDFEPRVQEALLLHERYDLHAGMDISDGLTLDLSRLCQASGCGAELDLAAIPLDAAADAWARQLGDGSTALEHALADGEDFELLLAADEPTAARLVTEQPLAVPLTRIGRCVAEAGLWGLAGGRREALAARGYLH
jgi:thiamine-monophosphate kinase